MATLSERFGSSTCPATSPEGLICTLAPHPGADHKDLSDPATEIQWDQPGGPPVITLSELVANVEDRVRARAAALLAQAPSPVAVADVVSAPSAGPRARFLGPIVPGRRSIPGERRQGHP